MGDVAVGARSGHDGPEGQPERPDDAAAPAVEGASGSGSESADGSATTERTEQDPKKKQRSFWKELPILIGIALVLALLIKTFLVQAFSIPSDSMQNTLQQGDRVLVDKLTPWFGSEPERGEVVVFHDPDGWLRGEPTANPNALQTVLSWIGLMPSAEEKDLIKRVIGVGGDTIQCKGTGPLTVNGKALNEPYVYPGNTPCSVDEDGGQFKVKVPKGMIWVMGDHRQNSRDSRYNQTDKHHGMVPVSEVVGRAIVKAWPINRWGTLPVPDTFGQDGLSDQAAAAVTSPASVALVGAVPLVLVRRKRKASK
ncbi:MULTISPECIES: signal peptidase I [unclassified Streptomyces]|uniref:signal peptidase I n=1 Tax=unclassified Streptomyces TaxID=2593676 RepID=UPI002E8177E2|nr:signal peptidase I [Streptomyces sp. NBC_00589]WTI35960.1 signal peptidase I [Streptomyces sp. NBC_00775]WUB30366.1 signal peptidase I [Streptomyces sp. NBC_00589]